MNKLFCLLKLYNILIFISLLIVHQSRISKFIIECSLSKINSLVYHLNLSLILYYLL